MDRSYLVASSYENCGSHQKQLWMNANYYIFMKFVIVHL